jgi:hypothetical protein
MKLGIMQPYLFPYIGYFQLIMAVDKLVLLDDVNFIKKGWINKNTILIDGKPKDFVFPLQKLSQNKEIRETYIFSDNKWKLKFLKTIQFNYKNAPYYSSFFPILEEIVRAKKNKINELNYFSLIAILNYLKINTEIGRTSLIYNNRHLKGQERILDICKQEEASHYINSIGGIHLYDPEFFTKNKIEFSFIKPKLRPYNQLKNKFIPGLSIIDVLMFNSPSEVIKLLDYELF